MRKSLEKLIEEKLKLEELVVEILNDAAYAERFISKPNNKNCPSMYKLLDLIYLGSILIAIRSGATYRLIICCNSWSIWL